MTSELLETKEELSVDDFFKQLETSELKRTNRQKYLKSKEYLDQLSFYNLDEIKLVKVNDVVSAKYLGVTDGQHTFRVKGSKDDVRVEFRPHENNYLKNTQIGDVVDVLILDIDEDNYFIRGSISAIYESKAHLELKSLEEGLSVDAYIKSMNPAGYEVEILHDGVTLMAFMPNTLAGINKLHNPESIVGSSFPVMIESYSNQEGTYIVSRRKYLKTLIPDAVEDLEEGVLYDGVVTGTTPFGIFVEFNECLTGMIHKANVDTSTTNIDDIRPGYKIKFYAKEVTKDRNGEYKIILTQVIRESIWDNIKIGQILDGKVLDNKQFGCLISLDDETMGLIHTSELEKLNRKLQKDQELKVKILAIERSHRKIFLTIP